MRRRSRRSKPLNMPVFGAPAPWAAVRPLPAVVPTQGLLDALPRPARRLLRQAVPGFPRRTYWGLVVRPAPWPRGRPAAGARGHGAPSAVGRVLALGEPGAILAVLTDSALEWDGSDYDTERSTALPPALRGRFNDDPRHLDLRWGPGRGPPRPAPLSLQGGSGRTGRTTARSGQGRGSLRRPFPHELTSRLAGSHCPL